MATVRIAVVLVLTLTLARTSLTCMCGLRHPQEMYCIADFVVKLDVLNMEEIYSNEIPSHSSPIRVTYTVDIKYVYKRTSSFHQANKVYLMTGGSSASCREYLEVGETYVVMGYVHGDQMSFGSCDWTRRASDINVNSHVDRGLRFKYNQGCDCQIQSCYGAGCNVPNRDTNTCTWTNINECDQNYSFCLPEGPGGRCVWRRNRMRTECLERLGQ